MFRDMRRSKQQLSQRECEEILRAAPRGILSVMGEDGYPYGVPMDFLWQDGKVYFHSAEVGHKVDALAACDRVCFTVLDEGRQEEGDWWYHFRSVIIFGRAHVVEDEGLRHSALVSFGRKYFPDEETVQSEIARDSGRALVLELEVDHMTGKAVREK